MHSEKKNEKKNKKNKKKSAQGNQYPLSFMRGRHMFIIYESLSWNWQQVPYFTF